ncbi:hypothetical protein NPIL_72161 [Nephila pilipes]|uniref:Uncharacterized protein n=1 Tax=Nephila pilipes TaxID=299642 RepID=A0A8X6NIU9_NEPPI|nr:hypothetical protein NPIL_72161 [Nephila pilipes]
MYRGAPIEQRQQQKTSSALAWAFHEVEVIVYLFLRDDYRSNNRVCERAVDDDRNCEINFPPTSSQKKEIESAVKTFMSSCYSYKEKIVLKCAWKP